MVRLRQVPFDIRWSSVAFRLRPAVNGTTVAPGLCGGCLHSRSVASGKGSLFWLCGLHATDPGFPKYPRLPVLSCRGYRQKP